jgi:hypothetical protein
MCGVDVFFSFVLFCFVCLGGKNVGWDDCLLIGMVADVDVWL